MYRGAHGGGHVERSTPPGARALASQEPRYGADQRPKNEAGDDEHDQQLAEPDSATEEAHRGVAQ
jgi:hypothetical protein